MSDFKRMMDPGEGSLDERAEKIVSEMTLQQKLGQIQCMYMGDIVPIQVLGHFPGGFGETAVYVGEKGREANAADTRSQQDAIINNCGIPALRHAEALSGLLTADATIFPSALGLGASFNPDLVEQMTSLISKQMYSIGIRQALSPVMDVARDPRWGRVGETYGEDPTLCSAMSVAFTKGLQGDDPKKEVVACGKHFLGYGMSQGGLNMAMNAISPRELREVYAKPFQAAITEGGLDSIMNSYGTIDNEMVVGASSILTDLLRDEMGFEGVVVSDYMSINRMVDLKIAETPAEGGKQALIAGLDNEMPTPYGYNRDIAAMIENGELDEAYLDRAVKRIIRLKLKMGLLDQPYGDESMLEEAYDRSAALPLSLEAARQAIVMTKNDGTLPVKNKKKIAVIGPHADNYRLLFGCYTFPAQIDRDLSGAMADMPGMSGLARQMEENENRLPYFPESGVRGTSPAVEEKIRSLYADHTPTILASIQKQFPDAEVTYVKGCEVAGNDCSGFAEAVAAAKNADLVIMTLGGKYGWGTNCTIGEGVDCDKVGLTGVQEQLLDCVCETKVPVVLIHMDAKPLTSKVAEEKCAAILENWYPGETGGQAIAEVLSGAYNPGGKLPITAVRSEGQIPLYHATQNGSGYYDEKGMVIAKYVENTKLPYHFFGEGMSYTTFEIAEMQIEKKEIGPEEMIRISCKVSNTGDMAGNEVVQLYVTDEIASMVRPAQELAGFYRVKLAAGETKTLVFEMKPSQFAFLNREMKWCLEKGTMTFKLGNSSRNISCTDSLVFTENAIVDGKTRGFFAKAYEA